MVVFIIREGLFNDRDGRGTGATTTFRAARLLVTRGPLHAERALVPLAMNPNVSEDTTLETSFMVTRVVLGQRSEDDGAAGDSFFFGKLNSTGKRIRVYPETSFCVNLTRGCRSMVAFNFNGVCGRASGDRSKGNKVCASRGANIVNR